MSLVGKILGAFPFAVAWALICVAVSSRAEGVSNNISAALQPFVGSHSLAGAVTLVASADKILDLECVGYSDVAAKIPMKPDSIFWIASQSKPMTATALMMLVDEGKVSVDDPVEKYLPEFKGQMVAERDGDKTTLKKPADPILVREILSHTSGLPFNSQLERPTLDGHPLAERVKLYAGTPLEFEPGTKYSYSNVGINTVGRIIEVVTEMPYEDFMRERLFEPLGMKDTTFWPTEAQVGRIAKSYRPNAAHNDLEEIQIRQLRYPLTDRTTRFAVPAGGFFSTAYDVARFCQMVLRGGELDGKRYLSEQAVKVMTSRQTPESIEESYGFGWEGGGDTFGHAGAEGTQMGINRKQGLVFVWMVQHVGFPNDGDKSEGVFIRMAGAQFAK